MVEIVGSVLMMVGGGLLTAAGLVRPSAVERARQLLGDSSPAVVTQLPPEMTKLLDRLG